MIARKLVRALRGATYTGDDAAVVALVRDEHLLDERDALQVVGDGLVVALAERAEGASEFAATCAARLRERGGIGDDVLADQLDSRPSPALRPVPVDLGQLTAVFEDSEGGRFDLQTGEAWPEYTFDPDISGVEPAEEDEDENRWLYIDGGSRDGYHDMQDFLRTRVDGELAERLGRALQGRGAFRRFKDVLADHDRLHEFHVFSEDRQRGRVRAWLADAGIAVAPRRPAG